MKMKLYRAEKEAGLAEKVLASACVYASQARAAAAPESPPRLPELPEHTRAGEKQPDLFYLDTVMVSTGWNLNDDVFDPVEVYRARATPEDKQFNIEHDCADIVGHITGSRVISDGKTVAAETVEEIPPSFDILTSAVLYRYWPKKELQERMDETIAGIAKGEWFVSMECLFDDFDYALSKDGQERLVARNDKTAFLTKHLRAYGGDGLYEGYKVGRVIKNITFSGKGLVKKPANPTSVILSVAKNARTDELPLPGELTKAVATVAIAEKAVEKVVEKLVEKVVENPESTAKLSALEAEVKSLKEANASLLVANKDVLERVTKVESEAAAAAESTRVAQSESRKYKRAWTISSRLGIGPERSEGLALGTLALADEDFSSHLDILEKTFSKKSVEKAPEKEPDKEKARATAAEIKEIVPEVKPALAVPSEIPGVDSIRKQVAAFLA